VVRGVPFLKDLPIIGILLCSKDFEGRAKEVLFIIRPTISNYGVPNKDVVEFLRQKHQAPQKPEELHEALMGSMGELLDGEKDEAMMTGEEQGPELAPSLDARPVDPNEPSGTQSEP
jgi:Flp pilus assembly secretin CpaC